MGRLFVEFVAQCDKAKYVCNSCKRDVASEESLVWEGFMGARTPALLFRHSVNLAASPAGKRREQLSTGCYTIQDVCCRACCSALGWLYLDADRADQQYKVGAVLLQQEVLERVPAPGTAAPRRIMVM